MPVYRKKPTTCVYKYSRIVRVLSSVRFEIEQKTLENCEPFVIYLLNSTGNDAKFEGFYGRIGCALSAVLISKQISNSSNYFDFFNFPGLSAPWWESNKKKHSNLFYFISNAWNNLSGIRTAAAANSRLWENETISRSSLMTILQYSAMAKVLHCI